MGKKYAPIVGEIVNVSVGEFGAEYGKYTKQGPVVDVLSSQFTVDVDGTILFFFLADQGLTWDHLPDV